MTNMPITTSEDRANTDRNADQPAKIELQIVIAWILSYMRAHRLKVGFDHSLTASGQIRTARNPSEAHAVLKTEVMTIARLQDLLLLASSQAGFKAAQVKAALRIVLQRRSKKRYFRVWAGVLNEHQTHDKEASDREWLRLNTLFTSSSVLPSKVLQSFVWACKQKAIGRVPTWHMMPVIYGKQGTGKTIFARKFPSPLQELVADGVLITDFADRRSADIYRYAVAICDDLEKSPAAMIATLKSVMTATTLRRRRMMTSMTDQIQQQCMPIGTSNVPVEELIQDPTGNRRFVTLEFRNGDYNKGGDEDVWDTVNNLDYNLLWRSVDAFGPNPIMPYLEELGQHQAQFIGTPVLLEWLKGLDLTSEELRSVRVRGGYSSEKLRALFMADTGEQVSQKRFADEMTRYFGRDESPFCMKDRDAGGVFYVAKPPKVVAATADVTHTLM